MSRYRHEYKYFIDRKQESILLIKANAIMYLDPNTDSDGTYLIRSLYFDDFNNTCYYENENGTDPRSKFRIRYYNNETKFIKLEKKSKSRGMTLKEAVSISEEECKVFMSGNIPEITSEMTTLKKQLFLEMKARCLIPKVIVTYRRIPYIYTGGNVRVTFDKDISSSNEFYKFLDGDYAVRPIMPLGISILEVKWDEVMPIHIKNVLDINSLQWTAFSKFYMCRKFSLMNN